MSPTPRSPTDDARGEPVRPARRPLTVRGVQQLPAPRVVLHLPDLEALSSVSLGPPQPAARRRVDPAHVVEPAAETDSATRASAPSNTATGRPSLAKFLKVPLDKLTPENIANGGKKLGQLALLIQQPKMMLAAVAAVALQLAALLAMFTGSGDKQPETSGDRPHGVHSHAPHGAPIVDNRRPIQTPLNSAPSQYSPMFPSIGPWSQSPISVAQPSPPQTLPGVQTDELPAWPGAEGPSLVGTPVGPTTSAGAPTTAPHGGSTRATPVGHSGGASGSGAAGSKPKLKGTILKVNEAAR